MSDIHNYLSLVGIINMKFLPILFCTIFGVVFSVETNTTIDSDLFLDSVPGPQPTCIVDEIKSKHPDISNLEGRWHLQLYSYNPDRHITQLSGWILDLFPVQKNVFMHRSMILDGKTDVCKANETGIVEFDVKHQVYKNAPGVLRFDFYLGDDQHASRQSMYYKILFVSGNYLVLYGCDGQKTDGTCNEDLAQSFVFSRNFDIPEEDFETLETMLIQTCIAEDRIIPASLGSPCIMGHLEERPMFDVRKNCDYHDPNTGVETNLAEVAGKKAYIMSSNIKNPNLVQRKASILPLSNPNELELIFYTAMSNLDTCQVTNATVRKIKGSNAIDLEEVSTSSPSDGLSRNMEWVAMEDAGYRAYFGCRYGDECTPEKAFTAVASDFKKQDKVDLNLVVYPSYAENCLEPQQLSYTDLDNKLCPLKEWERSCSMPVVKKVQFSMKQLIGTWKLVKQTHRMYYQLHHTYTEDPRSSGLNVMARHVLALNPVCQHTSLGRMYKELNTATLRGLLQPCTQEPELEAVNILHISEKFMLWHSCLSANEDGSCRFDRTYVMLWAKDPHSSEPTTSTDKVELEIIEQKLKEACVNAKRLELVEPDRSNTDSNVLEQMAKCA